MTNRTGVGRSVVVLETDKICLIDLAGEQEIND